MPPILIILLIIIYVFTQIVEFVKVIFPFLKVLFLFICAFLFIFIVYAVVIRFRHKKEEKIYKEKFKANEEIDNQNQLNNTMESYITEDINPITVVVPSKNTFIEHSICKREEATRDISCELDCSAVNKEVSNYEEERDRSSNHAIQANTKVKFKWYGRSELVNIHGYKIKNPMLYVGTSLPAKVYSTLCGNDACLINLHLEVASRNDSGTASQIPYYPHYSEITPLARKNYLQWLEDGRVDPSIYIGYVFLFFYGLERRLFHDIRYNPSLEEVVDILTEILRLIEIYKENQSFLSHAKRLLSMATIMYGNDEGFPNNLKNYNQDRNSLLFLQYSIAKLVAMRRPISAELVFEWIVAHPKYKPCISAKKCPVLLRKLFAIRYKEKYNTGILLSPSNEELEVIYHTANISLADVIYTNGEFLTIPQYTANIVKELFEIIASCSDELEAYARYLGKNESKNNMLTVITLLPTALIDTDQFINDCKEKLLNISIVQNSIKIKELYQHLGAVMPKEFTENEQESLSHALRSLGFDFAPNLKVSKILLPQHSKVILYKCEDTKPVLASYEYLKTCLVLEVGVFLSRSESFLKIYYDNLKEYILNNKYLSAPSKNSLVAILTWFFVNPSSQNEIVNKISKMSEQEQTELLRSLMLLNFIDNSTNNKENEHLEKICALLSLNVNLLDKETQTVAESASPKRKDSLDRAVQEKLKRFAKAGVVSIGGLYDVIGQKKSQPIQEIVISDFLLEHGFDFVPIAEYQNLIFSQETNIAIFENTTKSKIIPSSNYLNMCLLLEICVLLSNYGTFINITSDKLQGYIKEAHSFSQLEKNSLVAFLYWLTDYSPIKNEIVKKVERLNKSQEKLLMKSLFDIIKFIDSTDIVAPEKIEKIESILGIANENSLNPIQIPIKPKELIQEDKTIIKPEILESIVQTIAIKNKEDTNILPLPKEQPQKVKFTLDKELINRHEKETAEVQVLLNSIFTENDETMEAVKEQTEIKLSIVEELDYVYQNFFSSLIKQETWERDDITELCKNNNLMLDGAMEILNDWAYTHTDSPLLEDGDTIIYIDLEIAKELTQGD